MDLNDYLVHNKTASFLLTVTGNSMSGAGILDGDKVIVDRSVNLVHGKIIIAVINAEYTLKRLHNLHSTKPREETIKVMAILDVLNCRYGRDTLVLDSASAGGHWAIKAGNRTPTYTIS